MQTIIFSLPELEFKTLIQTAVSEAMGAMAPKPQGTPQSPELLTRNEAAKYLGVSLPTLNEWTKTGVVKGYRIGSRVRYKLPEIEVALKGIDTFKFKRGRV